MQALQRPGAPGAADTEIERGAAVAACLARRELAADSALVFVRLRAACGELGVSLGRTRPALDAACRLEPRDRGDEVPARDVVRRRERLAPAVVRLLLRDRGPAERAADDDALERPRLAAELPGDEGSISIHNGP